MSHELSLAVSDLLLTWDYPRHICHTLDEMPACGCKRVWTICDTHTRLIRNPNRWQPEHPRVKTAWWTWRARRGGCSAQRNPIRLEPAVQESCRGKEPGRRSLLCLLYNLCINDDTLEHAVDRCLAYYRLCSSVTCCYFVTSLVLNVSICIFGASSTSPTCSWLFKSLYSSGRTRWIMADPPCRESLVYKGFVTLK